LTYDKSAAPRAA